MKKCLKIHVSGNVQAVGYRLHAQKQATSLNIQGSVQNTDDGNVLIYACGNSVNLEKFIDHLYKGTTDSQIDDLLAEPFINEKDFRGVFRIIGD